MFGVFRSVPLNSGLVTPITVTALRLMSTVRPTMVGSEFQFNLNAHNKALLKHDERLDCYTGAVINTVMENWYVANCS